MIKVGFIGLGEQGKPMAVNLAKDGFDLIVHDLRPEPVDELIALGARAANSQREVAAGGAQSRVADNWIKNAERIQVMVQGSYAGARVRGRTRTRIAGNCDGARIDRVN